MSLFDAAFDELMILEGGGLYHEVAGDHGGATNYGVSLRFLKSANIDIDGDGHITKGDIKVINEHHARSIYKKYFWDHYKIELLSLWLQVRAFTMYVNMRSKSVGLILQRAVRASGLHIVEDGIVGPNTRKQLELSGSCTLRAIKSEQAAFYRMIAAKDSTQNKFLNGWLARAYR